MNAFYWNTIVQLCKSAEAKFAADSPNRPIEEYAYMLIASYITRQILAKLN